MIHKDVAEVVAEEGDSVAEELVVGSEDIAG